MAASAITRLGQANATGDANTLFKIVFGNMIATEFEKTKGLSSLIRGRGFPRGSKSFTLKFMGRAATKYHTPGQSVITDSGYTTAVRLAEREIKLNDKLVSAQLVDEMDELKNDFDARQQLAEETARALRDADDQLVFRAIVAAAYRNDNNPTDQTLYTGEPTTGKTTDGAITTTITGTPATDGATMEAVIKEAKQLFDSLSIPVTGRVLALRPEYFINLFSTASLPLLNRDWGGNGAMATGELPMALGFKIIVSENIPTTDLSADAALQTELNRNFTNTMGAFFHTDAAVRAAAIDVKTDVDVMPEYGHATLIQSKMAAAYGGYKRSCAIWWKKA